MEEEAGSREETNVYIQVRNSCQGIKLIFKAEAARRVGLHVEIEA